MSYSGDNKEWKSHIQINYLWVATVVYLFFNSDENIVGVPSQLCGLLANINDRTPNFMTGVKKLKMFEVLLVELLSTPFYCVFFSLLWKKGIKMVNHLWVQSLDFLLLQVNWKWRGKLCGIYKWLNAWLVDWLIVHVWLSSVLIDDEYLEQNDSILSTPTN